MRRFQDYSIRWKLIFMMTLSSGVLMVLAAVAILTESFLSNRHVLIQDLSMIGKIIGDNSSAALAFNDQKSAKEILNSLKEKQSIMRAAIYDKEG